MKMRLLFGTLLIGCPWLSASGATQIPAMTVPTSWIDVDNVTGPVNAGTLNAAGTNGGSFGGLSGQGVTLEAPFPFPGDPPLHSVSYGSITTNGAGLGASSDLLLTPSIIQPGEQFGPAGTMRLHLDGMGSKSTEFGFALGNSSFVSIAFFADGNFLDVTTADFSLSPDPQFFRCDTPFDMIEIHMAGPFEFASFVVTDFYLQVPTPASAVLMGLGGLSVVRRRRR